MMRGLSLYVIIKVRTYTFGFKKVVSIVGCHRLHLVCGILYVLN